MRGSPPTAPRPWAINLHASFDGQTYALRGEAGYRHAVTSMTGVTPYAALQTQWSHTPGYSETDLTGGGFGLTFNSQTVNDTRSEPGARADDLTMLGGTPLLLRARLAWAHDWVSGTTLGAVFQALRARPSRSMARRCRKIPRSRPPARSGSLHRSGRSKSSSTANSRRMRRPIPAPERCTIHGDRNSWLSEQNCCSVIPRREAPHTLGHKTSPESGLPELAHF